MAQPGRDIGREKETADNLQVGPGVVATKSQAKGAGGGILIGGLIGAVIGLVVGLVAGGAAVWIAPITFAIAGAVALGVFGGFAKSQDTREKSRVDV